MLLPPPQVRRYTPRKTGSAHDVLHKVIREHLGELISMTEERGRPLRPYVLHELAGYLACGRPEAGCFAIHAAAQLRGTSAPTASTPWCSPSRARVGGSVPPAEGAE